MKLWVVLILQSKSFQVISACFTHLPTKHSPFVRANKAKECVSLRNLSAGHVVTVEKSLEALYPTVDLEKRNSLSRTDGYWKYIKEGKEPPTSLTYGEFDIEFFADILDRTAYHFDSHASKGWDNKVFADFGSGAGRLVLGAAALNPKWKLCKGIEILPGIHELARENLNRCSVNNGKEQSFAIPLVGKPGLHRNESDENLPYIESLSQNWNQINSLKESRKEVQRELPGSEDHSDDSMYLYSGSAPVATKSDEHCEENSLPLAPIEFICGSFDDPNVYLGDVDLIFCFSSCFPDGVIEIVSRAAGRCRPGTILVTTDYEPPLEGELLPDIDDLTVPYGAYRLEKIESVEGACVIVGGVTEAHIYRVVQSVWNENM